MSKPLNAEILDAAQRIGRETTWSVTEAEINIRYALQHGITVIQCERIMRAGLSMNLVVRALNLECHQ